MTKEEFCSLCKNRERCSNHSPCEIGENMFCASFLFDTLKLFENHPEQILINKLSQKKEEE